MAEVGYNGLISTQQMGNYRIRVVKIYHGVNIIASEAKGQVRRAFYPFVTTSSGFGLDIAFPDYDSRTAFSVWLQQYMEHTIAGRGFKAPCYVDIPNREFSRSCIPLGSDRGGPIYGEGLTDVGYVLNISFTGASDPVEIGPESKGVRSFFVLPTKDVKQSKNFYPGGKQLSGAESLEGSLYDGWETGGGLATEQDQYASDPNSDDSVAGG